MISHLNPLEGDLWVIQSSLIVPLLVIHSIASKSEALTVLAAQAGQCFLETNMKQT